MNGQYQNYIEDLPGLEIYRYENIFKVYTTEDKNFYFYNIIKNIQVPKDINSNIFYNTVLQENTPFPVLSYNIYGTTYLWWLICILNDVKNPFDVNNSGKTFKILKKEYVKPVLDQIKQQLQ